MSEFKQLNRKEYDALDDQGKKAFQDSFVEYYLPMVENAIETHKKGNYSAGASNLDSKLILAQMIKESGWGVSGLSFGHNNFGGLKASNKQINTWVGGKTPAGREDISGWTSMGTTEDFTSEKQYLAYKEKEERLGNKTYLTKRKEGDQEIWTANLGQPFLTFDTPQKGINHQVRWWSKFGGITEGDDAVTQIKKVQDAGYATSVGYQDSIINMYYKPLTLIDTKAKTTKTGVGSPTFISKQAFEAHKNNQHKNVNLDGNVVVQNNNGDFVDPIHGSGITAGANTTNNNNNQGPTIDISSEAVDQTGIAPGTQTTGSNTTTGTNTTETTETTETTAEKFTHKNKQVEANANNPEYVEKLKARGFTVEEYLENPQDVLNQLSKLSDLDKSVFGGDKNIELTTSQGPKKKKVEEGEYKDIEDTEEDDADDFPKVEGPKIDISNQTETDEDSDESTLISELSDKDLAPPKQRIMVDYNTYSSTENYGLDRMSGISMGPESGGTGGVTTVLSKDDLEYIEKEKKNLTDAEVKIGTDENGFDISTNNILRKKNHEDALKLVNKYDKKAENSALAHLTQMYPEAKFSNKQEWLNYASKNNIDGELAFQDATPSDTEEVANARERLAGNRETFEEVFSLSKYSGSHLNKVVALFGGHESENLDFGLLANEMEAASLMFMTSDEIARMQNNAALDLPKDRKNEIIFKSKMYVLNEYVKKTEDTSCDLENDINLFNDNEADLLKEKNAAYGKKIIHLLDGRMEKF